MGGDQRRVLVIGAGFAGFVVARHMRNHFKVTVIDAKEYFEYTPGILRAFVHPAHFEPLTFMLQPVLEEKLGCRFIWGEVTGLDAETRTCKYKTMHGQKNETLGFDYCVIACGCNFGQFSKLGESLWFPSVWEKTRAQSDWKQHDERYLDGRRDHINEEFGKIQALNKKAGSVLIVGAGFIGVEFATEIQYFFPKIKIMLIDMLPKCLGPLPLSAKDYCQNYMDKVGIKTKYGIKYNASDPEGWKKPMKKKDMNAPFTMDPAAYEPAEPLMDVKPDMIYISTGFKASCYFMPNQVFTQYSTTDAEPDRKHPDRSKWGPSGGGWINTDIQLRPIYRHNDKEMPFLVDDKGNGRAFAVGDCNLLGMLKPIPKISYPGEEMAAVACRNIEVIEKTYYNGATSGCYTIPARWPIIPCYGGLGATDFWWPWGSGMFATSLGVDDACFVIAATHEPGSGYMCVWGYVCSWQKWFIEWSKVDQCKEGWIGWATWMSVH